MHPRSVRLAIGMALALFATAPAQVTPDENPLPRPEGPPKVVKIESSDWIIRCAALTGDGSRLALGSESGELSIWETRTGKLIRTLRAEVPAMEPGVFVAEPGEPQDEGNSWPIDAVAFDPGDKLIAASTNWGFLEPPLDLNVMKLDIRPRGSEIGVWDEWHEEFA